jgi:hypothetical protein
MPSLREIFTTLSATTTTTTTQHDIMHAALSIDGAPNAPNSGMRPSELSISIVTVACIKARSPASCTLAITMYEIKSLYTSVCLRG